MMTRSLLLFPHIPQEYGDIGKISLYTYHRDLGNAG
jgi:hypothetical protein